MNQKVVKYRPDENQQHPTQRVTKSKLSMSIFYCNTTKMPNNTKTRNTSIFFTYHSLVAFVFHFEPGKAIPYNPLLKRMTES